MSHFEATLDLEFDTSFYIYVTPPPLLPPQTQAGRLTVYLSVSRGICMLVKLLA